MNRRNFIKTGSGAFAIAAAGCAIGDAAASNRVRLAIVGCHEKGRGVSVLRAAMKVPGVEIAYVCDVDSRARDFAADLVEKTSGFRPKKEKDLRSFAVSALVNTDHPLPRPRCSPELPAFRSASRLSCLMNLEMKKSVISMLLDFFKSK